MNPGRCYACDKPIKTMQAVTLVMTSDDSPVWVGRDCARHIRQAGDTGYQPPKGGPVLFYVEECYCADYVAAKGPYEFCELKHLKTIY